MKKGEKGDVWIVDLPISDGHEQQGTRPVVIIAELEAGMAFVIPCTTNEMTLRFPHVIEIGATKRNGLSAASIALVFQLRAVDSKRLVKKIGTAEPGIMHAINMMIKGMFGF